MPIRHVATSEPDRRAEALYDAIVTEVDEMPLYVKLQFRLVLDERPPFDDLPDEVQEVFRRVRHKL